MYAYLNYYKKCHNHIKNFFSQTKRNVLTNVKKYFPKYRKDFLANIKNFSRKYKKKLWEI